MPQNTSWKRGKFGRHANVALSSAGNSGHGGQWGGRLRQALTLQCAILSGCFEHLRGRRGTPDVWNRPLDNFDRRIYLLMLLIIVTRRARAALNVTSGIARRHQSGRERRRPVWLMRSRGEEVIVNANGINPGQRRTNPERAGNGCNLRLKVLSSSKTRATGSSLLTTVQHIHRRK